VSSATPQKNVTGAEDPFVAEDRLIRQARAALPNDPALALSLTSAHARRFPDGTLEQEREVIAIEALTKLGRDSEARERAATFTQHHPTSAYRARVEQLVSHK